MINYTNINDAWGNIDEKKETFKNLPKKNIHKEETKSCDIIEHLIKCKKCSKKIENLFLKKNIINKNKDKKIEYLSNDVIKLKKSIKKLLLKYNSNSNINSNINSKNKSIKSIEGFSLNFKVNKHLKIFSLIISMVIILVLLIHSYRKPIKLETAQKSFYIFPEDIDKLKSLIKST